MSTPSTSRFERMVDALWTKIAADTTFCAFLSGGELYKFADGELLRKLDYESLRCPFLAMAPAPAGSQWRAVGLRSVGEGEERLALSVEGGTKGQDRRQILELAEAFRDFLSRQIATGFALGIDEPYEIAFEGLEFEPRPSKENVIELWVFRVTCIVKFQLY